ncbi:MAG: hypothetical protein COA32_01580 [Fluviicola sp.]|nr:MAG: hypothetical protein COA32_01580 [Fluviicola sp.]
METIKIRFLDGLLTFDDSSVQFNADNPNLPRIQSINLKDVGTLNYSNYIFLKRMPIQYGLRFGLGGILIIIASIILGYALDKGSLMSIGVTVGIIMEFFGIFLVLGDLIIDGLFGGSLIIGICESIWGEKGFEVNINHNSGNQGICFYTALDEESKIKKAIKALETSVKGFSKSESEATQHKRSHETPKESTNTLKDLEKLAELKDKGIITEQEFELKKKQILNL